MPIRAARPLGALFAAALTLGVAGCQDHNQQALQLGALPPAAAQLRELQTLVVPVADEGRVLRDATQVLLDLGFAIDESSAPYGVVVGSKQRDAREAGQVAAAIAVTVVTALFLVPVIPTWDQDQTIRATVTTRPAAGQEATLLRVSFERRVRNNQGGSRFEPLQTPAMYQEFFGLVRQGMSLGERT